MKLIVVSMLLLSSLFVFAQDERTVFLKWKVPQGRPLSYHTAMEEVDTAYKDFSMDLGSFLDSNDTLKVRLDEASRLFSKLNKAVGMAGMTTTFTYDRKGYIDIVMSLDAADKKAPKDSVSQMLDALRAAQGNVLLRGAVNENGTIQSFYVKNDQRNLIALLFELPNKPVAVGDSWPLSVNLLSMDQSFRCDSSFKKNMVTLVGLEKAGSDRVALISYDIVEYISGDFNSPFSNGPVKTTMRMGFQGLAEFSTAQGRWIAYSGIMYLTASGALNSQTTKHFALSKM